MLAKYEKDKNTHMDTQMSLQLGQLALPFLAQYKEYSYKNSSVDLVEDIQSHLLCSLLSFSEANWKQQWNKKKKKQECTKRSSTHQR